LRTFVEEYSSVVAYGPRQLHLILETRDIFPSGFDKGLPYFLKLEAPLGFLGD
jgi:hypothetical protein